jgi:hypothetical protein
MLSDDHFGTKLVRLYTISSTKPHLSWFAYPKVTEWTSHTLYTAAPTTTDKSPNQRGWMKSGSDWWVSQWEKPIVENNSGPWKRLTDKRKLGKEMTRSGKRCYDCRCHHSTIASILGLLLFGTSSLVSWTPSIWNQSPITFHYRGRLQIFLPAKMKLLAVKLSRQHG